jgi:hypothetical protein
MSCRQASPPGFEVRHRRRMNSQLLRQLRLAEARVVSCTLELGTDHSVDGVRHGQLLRDDPVNY